MIPALSGQRSAVACDFVPSILYYVYLWHTHNIIYIFFSSYFSGEYSIFEYFVVFIFFPPPRTTPYSSAPLTPSAHRVFPLYTVEKPSHNVKNNTMYIIIKSTTKWRLLLKRQKKVSDWQYHYCVYTCPTTIVSHYRLGWRIRAHTVRMILGYEKSTNPLVQGAPQTDKHTDIPSTFGTASFKKRRGLFWISLVLCSRPIMCLCVFYI